ncbi:helix-turn-helix domain-containing protein [Enterococcus sp. GC34]|uniref:helix-turn-helix domain-containing protein n=1 Tax=Enterococcus sp. GC34 TaxID=3231353 RepID=UPI00349FF2EA
MNLLERIKKLAKDRNLSIYQLEEEINIGRNTIYQWNKRTPSSDKLEAVANYFNVSVDYLLGRTENPNPDNIEEDEIATFFRVNTEDLTESEKNQLREELKEYLEFMKSRLKNK